MRRELDRTVEPVAPTVVRAPDAVVLERTGAAAALMPLLFAVYLASVPRLAVQPALLFGFLLLLDAGLLAIVGDHAHLRHADPLVHTDFGLFAR